MSQCLNPDHPDDCSECKHVSVEWCGYVSPDPKSPYYDKEWARDYSLKIRGLCQICEKPMTITGRSIDRGIARIFMDCVDCSYCMNVPESILQEGLVSN